MIKAVLFDLDGTLLPMEDDKFTKSYFKRMAIKLAPYGYDPKELIDAVWKGTALMVKNDGSKTNEKAFWDCFVSIYGEKALEHKSVFDEYYDVEFSQVKDDCGYNPKAKETVDLFRSMGLKIALATNPLFPKNATINKMNWAGLLPTDFEVYTTYEECSYAKPNPKYYEYVANKLDLKPEECLMVGNNVSEDMIARTIGMKVFLLSDCLINKNDDDISCFEQGSFDELIEYVKSILE